MCGGPTSTQEQLQSEEAQFYATQIDAYNTAYGNFKDISDRLNAQFAPIIAKGPNQFGFSDEEYANLKGMAIEGTAREYNKAQRALNENEAAMGGGNSNVNMTSGGAQQEREQLAATGAGIQSSELQEITQAGYQQGYNEYENAVQGEEAVAAGWNPNSFAGSVNNSGQVANSEANQIAQEQQNAWGMVLGALGGTASSIISENPHNVFG